MSEKVYDFIISDLLMPKKDGYAILEERKNTKNPDTPVCVLTVMGQEQSLQRAKDLGAWKCFVKSNTTLTHILEVIEEELERIHGKK
jgi:CheY-like chemotaxis protein